MTTLTTWPTGTAFTELMITGLTPNWTQPLQRLISKSSLFGNFIVPELDLAIRVKGELLQHDVEGGRQGGGTMRLEPVSHLSS